MTKFVQGMIDFIKEKQQMPHVRSGLLFFPVTFNGSQLNVHEIRDKVQFFVFNRTANEEVDWSEAEKILAEHEANNNSALTFIVETEEGVHFYPTRPKPPQFIVDLTEGLYGHFCEYAKTVN